MPPLKQNSMTKKFVAGSIAALVVIALIASIANYEINMANAKTTAAVATSSRVTSPVPSQTTTAPESSSSSTSTNTSSYKDGAYSALSDYYVPHGNESIKVTVTLKNGVVTNSEIINSEGDPESASFQRDFANEYKSSVVGKNIDSVHLSYVAGASDTTAGFNDALDQIISKARA